MSTRCHIIIRDESNNFECRIYHHFDGYPEGVGADLKKYLSQRETNWFGTYIANDLIKGKITTETMNGLKPDMGYEVTFGIHGDEEFVYIIDCDEQTLKCYSMEWDETLKEIEKAERVVEIP